MDKKSVKKKLPESYCVKMEVKIGEMKYIVWAGKIRPRGFEMGAIGLGKTAAKAWGSVVFETQKQK